MATISGKRFQITDGASTPTNLFPYTVTEAVYGLSTVIEAAKTAVTNSLTAVTLNGVSKAGTTASFYAPAASGTTGQILKATTSGAPVWTSAALGAENKPIYLNSSGVLTEGAACVTIAGTETITGAKTFTGGITSSGISISATNPTLIFKNSGGNFGRLYMAAANGPFYRVNSDWSGQYVIYDSGNSNKSDVPWACKTLFVGSNDSGWTTTIASTNSAIYLAHASGSAIYAGTKLNDTSGYLLDLRYGQTTLGSAGSYALYVRADGNVGIGTNAPSEKLDVYGGNAIICNTGGATLTLTGVARNGNNGAILFMDTYPANGQRNGFKIASEYTASQSRQSLVFYSSNSTTSPYTPVWAAAMTIRHDGNVGIGTASPESKLDVDGAIKCASIYVNRGVSETATGIGFWGTNSITSYGLFASTTTNYGTFGAVSGDFAVYFTMSGSAVGRGWMFKTGSYGIVASISQGGILTTKGDQVVSSDASLKTNLKDVTYSVSDIAACRAVTFDWKDGRGRSAGSIAQDWKPLIPELVHGEEGSMTLAYGQIALINTIIEAREIDALKKRVAELEEEVKRLRS